MKRVLSLFMLLMSVQSFSAVVDTYQFDQDDQDDQRQRYHQLIAELRCPKCQNQNLSGSNSPIAKDLRREVYRLINENQNDSAIKAFMVKRYGNFVLYEPPVDAKTYVLWFSPIVLLFLGFMLIIFLKRKQQAQSLLRRSDEQYLSDRERQRLHVILDKYNS